MTPGLDQVEQEEAGTAAELQRPTMGHSASPATARNLSDA